MGPAYDNMSVHVHMHLSALYHVASNVQIFNDIFMHKITANILLSRKIYMNVNISGFLLHDDTLYSRTSVARTLMARLPRLLRTRS